MIMEQGCHMEKFCYAKQNQIKNSQPQANCVNDNQETFFLFIYLLASYIDDKKKCQSHGLLATNTSHMIELSLARLPNSSFSFCFFPPGNFLVSIGFSWPKTATPTHELIETSS